MEAPAIVKPIPAQVINERAAYGPFNLAEFIKTPDGSTLRFSAELTNGQALPKGLICTSDGALTGIPGKNTQGNYDVQVTAENTAGAIQASFTLMIKPSLAGKGEDDYLDKLKSQVWEAIEQNLSIPDFNTALQPITVLEIYYLLERWSTLKIWDAFNLEPPGEKTLLTLPGTSPHYDIYDRGSCLVAAPKDLFSHERTIADGIQTAIVMAKEAYKRNWTVELVGFSKLTRAAWVEIQRLGDENKRPIEVINFTPTLDDMKLYTTQSVERKFGRTE